MALTFAVLRIIHILSGVFWAGGGFMLTGYIGPTAQELQADAAKFMQTMNKSLPIGMGIASTLTLLSGLTMYILEFQGTIVYGSLTTTALTLGALCGIIAYLIGILVMMKNNNRIAEIGKAVAASGAPPTPEQMAELARLQESNAKAGMWVSILAGLAIIGMTLSEQKG